MPYLPYAGIGSRETPESVLAIMTQLAKELDHLGYTLRSGGANGADTAFEKGSTCKEIFLPWRGFNKNPSDRYIVSEAAHNLTARFHPAWAVLPRAVRLLMARNANQVMGETLDAPAKFVICWTRDGAESPKERTSKTGGTGQAIAIASHYGIPVFNLQKTDAHARLLMLVNPC